MAWELGCPRLPPAAPHSSACTWAADAAYYRRIQAGAYVNPEGATAASVVALVCTCPLVVALHQFVAMVSERHLWPRAAGAAKFAAALVPLVWTYSAPHLVWVSSATLVGASLCLAALAEDPLVWPRVVARCRAAHAARKEYASPVSFTCVDEAGQRFRFVAEYRAAVMITTCVAIMAVDFPSIFPRAHAKTEEYGYSIMDLGTGSIICTSAVCSRAARGLRGGGGRRLGAVLRRAASLWPVLLLGFIRFAVLWGVDYHVPTSEYGVHWNFFFSIVVVACVSSAADLGPAASSLAGVLSLGAYQVFLSRFGGADFILKAPRVGFFSANREGILGCAGFLGIHWLAVGLGACIRSEPPFKVLRWLFVISAGGIAATLALGTLGLPVSRRMCNLPYATFVLGMNSLMLALLALLDLRWPMGRPKLALVYGGVQDSMFATFLAANLLTGFVNLFFQPLLVPACYAMLVMVCYSVAWALPFSVLYFNGMAIKFF